MNLMPTVTSSTTNIILIRHGETAWNAERRLQGHLDIALNQEGERQARALAAALAGERLDLIVASDLLRARQTAAAVAAGRGVTVRLDAGLRERCYGGFEGLLRAEIAQRFPAEFNAWQGREVDAVLPPGANRGETFRQFHGRVLATVLRWAQSHPGRTVALVAHGGVLECAYRTALDLPLGTPRDFPVQNASINRFLLRGEKLALQSWGEVDHLRQDALDDLP
jgi:probable phosphoglycerate mutase